MRITALLPDRLRRHAAGEDPGVAEWRIRRGRPAPWADERSAEPVTQAPGSRLLSAPAERLLAPTDGQPDPLPRRPRPVTAPFGEHPYSDIPAEQVAAYRLAFAPQRPAPAYRRAPGAAPATAPMAVLPADAEVPVLVATKDPGALQRAAGLLWQVDFADVDTARQTEGVTYASVHAARAVQRSAPVFGTPPAAPEAAPAPSRADLFVADMRFRGGLPLFRRTAHAVGWRGLNEEPPQTGWARYTVARWDQQARIAIAAATEAARAEIGRDASEWDRREAQARSAAGSAPGYEGDAR